MESPNQTAALLGKLLENIDIAMLTTVGKQGYLVSRPLSTQKSSFDGRRVWFFTEADSPKIAEIRRNAKVNLAYASKDKNTYVSVAGHASINRDRAKIEELWSDALKAFFPKGKDDPNLVLLEVEVRTVEYWDGPGTLIGKLVTFIIARVTKKEEVMGENRLLDLRGKRATSHKPPSAAGAKRTGGSKAAAKKAPRKTTKSAASKPLASEEGDEAGQEGSKEGSQEVGQEIARPRV